MQLKPKFRRAQVLSDWIERENVLTPDEASAERACHRLLVNITRPAPSAWMFALADALAPREGGAP